MGVVVLLMVSRRCIISDIKKVCYFIAFYARTMASALPNGAFALLPAHATTLVLLASIVANDKEILTGYHIDDDDDITTTGHRKQDKSVTGRKTGMMIAMITMMMK